MAEKQKNYRIRGKTGRAGGFKREKSEFDQKVLDIRTCDSFHVHS